MNYPLDVRWQVGSGKARGRLQPQPVENLLRLEGFRHVRTAQHRAACGQDLGQGRHPGALGTHQVNVPSFDPNVPAGGRFRCADSHLIACRGVTVPFHRLSRAGAHGARLRLAGGATQHRGEQREREPDVARWRHCRAGGTSPRGVEPCCRDENPVS